MYRITEARPVTGHVLRIGFADGKSADIDFSKTAARGGIFAPLRDPTFFKQVRIGTDGRTLEWPGDLDFCADALHLQADGLSSYDSARMNEPAGAL